jgi:hypothetical protein
MATPAQIVSNVLDILERPDLYDLGISRFQSALKTVHSIERLRRDLANERVLLSDYSVIDGKVGIPIPARFRDMYRLWSSNSAGEVDREFYSLGNRIELKTYYGFKILQTYNIFGSILNITGISVDATHLEIDYLRFPTWELVDDEWETDSWIAVEEPGLLESAVRVQLAGITEDSDQIRSAEREFAFRRQEFINNYVGEIV